MSEQMVRKTADRVRVRTMAQIAVLGAAAAVLMALEFPVPFLAPPFYKLDFSEIPVLVGAFALGPAAGAAIELLKVLLHMLLQGTQTAGVGDLANFLIGCSYVIPAAMIYRSKKTRRRAVAGLAAGSVLHGFRRLCDECLCSASRLCGGFPCAGGEFCGDGGGDPSGDQQPVSLLSSGGRTFQSAQGNRRCSSHPADL